MDWLITLDFERALRNCHVDMVGDWFRDPWGWPELDWVVKKKHRDLVVGRLNATGVRKAAKITVAKENFGIRPAIVMDPLDRLCYQALVDRQSKELVGDLSPSVYGWRLIEDAPAAGKYARNDLEWEKYRDLLKRLTSHYSYALKTDVVQCFPSIPLNGLCDLVHEKCGANRIAGRLVDMLLAWGRIPGRSGIPQRFLASAVLANAYLMTVDDVFGRYKTTKGRMAALIPEGRAARWMDDMWLFGTSSARLRRAQIELQEALHSADLRMNLAKTNVFEGDELASEVSRMEHSAVDNSLKWSNVKPLEELVDEVVGHPEHSDRTTLRFLSTRMRWHDEFRRVPDLVEVAERIPHGADHLARLFNASEAWRDLLEWYVQYSVGDWGSIEWSVAQLGTMFPSSEAPAKKLADFMAAVVEQNRGGLTLQVLAAQRITAWDRDTARVICREAANRADHPLQRRAFALAALSAGEPRTKVRRLLGEFEENNITLAMLEDTNFKKPTVKADFDGD